MTPPATSNLHLSKLKKTADNAASVGLGRILVVQQFACPPVGGHLVLYASAVFVVNFFHLSFITSLMILVMWFCQCLVYSKLCISFFFEWIPCILLHSATFDSLLWTESVVRWFVTTVLDSILQTRNIFFMEPANSLSTQFASTISTGDSVALMARCTARVCRTQLPVLLQVPCRVEKKKILSIVLLYQFKKHCVFY